MKLKFELDNYDPMTLDEWNDEIKEMLERDTELFNTSVSLIEHRVGNGKFDEIDNYRYELDNLTKDEIENIESFLDEVEEKFEICFITWEQV